MAELIRLGPSAQQAERIYAEMLSLSGVPQALSGNSVGGEYGW